MCGPVPPTDNRKHKRLKQQFHSFNMCLGWSDRKLQNIEGMLFPNTLQTSCANSGRVHASNASAVVSHTACTAIAAGSPSGASFPLAPAAHSLVIPTVSMLQRMNMGAQSSNSYRGLLMFIRLCTGTKLIKFNIHLLPWDTWLHHCISNTLPAHIIRPSLHEAWLSRWHLNLVAKFGLPGH